MYRVAIFGRYFVAGVLCVAVVRYGCMKVLLLGASGLLGRNVMQVLVRRGHAVVALVRQSRRVADVEALPASAVRLVEGDLLRRDVLKAAAQGCDAIINCAGTTDMSLRHYADYVPVNVTLVQLLLDVSAELGIGTLVHVSTANTVDYGTSQQPAREQGTLRSPFAEAFYAQSKMEGERLVRQAATRRADDHLVVVNPGFMVGAFDSKPSSGKLLQAAYRRPVMVAPRGGKSFVPVADAAEAVANALTRGRNGSRYLLTGDNLSLAAFYRLQADAMGYRQRVWQLPSWFVAAAGRVGDGLRWLGIRTQLSSVNVRQLMVREYYDCTSAEEELGLPHTDLAQAVRDYFAWRQAHRR